MDEFLLLVGDAAHTVVPSTGEGVSSGLEDCYILGQIIDESGKEDCFGKYNSRRNPEIQELMLYANFLNDSFHLTTPGEKFSRLIYGLLESVLRNYEWIKAIDVTDYLYGASSCRADSFTYIFEDWKRHQNRILPILRIIFYPIAFIIQQWKVLLLPCLLAYFYPTEATAAYEWLAEKLSTHSSLKAM